MTAPDSQLIGGSNNIVINDTFKPSAGTVAISRGVLQGEAQRVVRVSFSERVDTANLAVAILLNGQIKVAPNTRHETTVVI